LEGRRRRNVVAEQGDFGELRVEGRRRREAPSPNELRLDVQIGNGGEPGRGRGNVRLRRYHGIKRRGAFAEARRVEAERAFERVPERADRLEARAGLDG